MLVYGAGAAFLHGAGAAFLHGAGADPIWPQPESTPGPRTSGAGQQSGGSATLGKYVLTIDKNK